MTGRAHRRGLARCTRTLGLIALVLVLMSAVGACGKKGPPLAPLRPVPEPVADLVARRTGSAVSLRFTIPVKNAGPTGTSPASLDRLEVYAFTDDPVMGAVLPISNSDVFKVATKIATVAVRPPPPPETEAEPAEGQPVKAAPPPPPDARPAQGEVVVVTESLAAVSRVPIDRAALLNLRLPPPPPIERRMALPLGPPIEVKPPVRRYLVVGFSRRGDRGNVSARVTVSLGEPPQVPSAPLLKHTQTAVQLTWTPPADAPVPVQVTTVGLPASKPIAPTATPSSGTPPADAPATVTTLGPLASKSIAPAATLYRYSVYGVDGPGGVAGGVARDPGARRVACWGAPRRWLGRAQCYVVRAARYYGDLGVEGSASPAACLTPTDVFPPVAPAKLTAVATEGAISLIWDRSSAADVAGYLVLRGEAPGDTLVELTAEPINTTTYRDTTVTSGARYVYAVVAVDQATPPNRSELSNRVEESAR